MRRAPLALAGIALAAACLCGPAAAERLVLSLSSHQIAIESNYTGSQLVLYGLIERDGQSGDRSGDLDVVVTVRGPRESLTVRRKEALGPVWINRAQEKFVAVPAVLGVFASRPVEEIADQAARNRFRLGLQAIVQAPEFALDPGGADDPFRAALIRLKTRDRLWRTSERGVAFVTGGLFRAPLPLPGTAPTGSYDVEAALLSDGVVIARRETSFEVVKAGFEEQVTSFAQDRGLPYGLFVATLSLGFGWIASMIFRRD